MRITVGGALVVLTLGGLGLWTGAPYVKKLSPAKFSFPTVKLAEKVSFLKKFSKPAAPAPVETYNPPPPIFNDTTPQTPLEKEPVAETPAAVVAPLVSPSLKESKRVKRKLRKKTAPKPPAVEEEVVGTHLQAVKRKPVRKGLYNDLIGKYVSLELQSGNFVKGILEGQNEKAYKVELPGMGSFTYAKNDVKSIKLVE